MKKLPNHIALIMDGNRRWATKRGLPKIAGHTKGAENIRPILQKCLDLGISYVTLWALSTENVKKRSEKELKHIYSLFTKLVNYLGDFAENDAKLQIIGDITVLPQKVQDSLSEVIEKTRDNTNMVLTLAVNYGGRDEIVRATKSLLASGISPEELSEEEFEKHLDSGMLPDPELIIRTGGHQRLSGYLPWKSTYAELYFTQEYWPGFTPELLEEAIDWFKSVQRNKGR